MSLVKFDPSIAQERGVDAAVIYEYVSDCIHHAEVAEQGFLAGRYWVDIRRSELHREFPFISEEAIRVAIDELCPKHFLALWIHEKEGGDEDPVYLLAHPERKDGGAL